MRPKAKAATIATALAFFFGAYDICFAVHAQDGLIEDPGSKARALFSKGQYKECLQFVEPLALGGEKKNAEVQYYYAALLKYFGRKEEAIAHFEEVLNLAPFGWMETYAKDNLRELREAPKAQSGARNVGKTGSAGYTGLKVGGDKILQVFPGSPAAQAHLVAGDKIISVDGVPIQGLTPEDVGGRMLGAEGTKVVLVIERQRRQYSTSIVRSRATAQQADALRAVSATGNYPGAATASSSASAANSSRALSAAASAKLLANDPQIIVFRHTSDTDAMRSEVVSNLVQLSPNMRTTLGDWGLKIEITPTILDAMPDLVNERPRGYSHGGGYTNCGGLYMGGHKTLYVSERVSPGTYVPHLNTRMGPTFFHEFGHAFDHCKQVSTSDTFKSAYQSDNGHLTNGLREHFYYYTQSEEAGPSELFAELFACAVRPAADLDTDSLNLTKTFPACFAQVKKVVAGAS
jgi:tetratricopeptide (TPR) repeat protein